MYYRNIMVLLPKWCDCSLCLQSESVDVVLCRVHAVICRRAAVKAAKHTGLCVSWELVLILGGLSFLFAGCHGNISARTQSDVYICGTAVWETAESHVTPFLLLHTLNIPLTLSSSVFVDMQTTYFSAPCIPFLNIVNLASSLLLFFLFLHRLSLSRWCLSCTLLDFSTHCFGVLWDSVHFPSCISHDWGLDLNIISAIRCAHGEP